MKKLFVNITALALMACATVSAKAIEIKGVVVEFAVQCGEKLVDRMFGHLVDVGFIQPLVQLNRNYMGYPAGQIVEFPASTEASLIASGGATVSAGPPTTGNVSTTALSGSVAIAAGSSSVTITNPAIGVQSQVWAVVSQAAADGTLLRVERVVPAAGSVTIYGTANATATTVIDWALLNPNGSLSNPQ